MDSGRASFLQYLLQSSSMFEGYEGYDVGRHVVTATQSRECLEDADSVISVLQMYFDIGKEGCKPESLLDA